MDRQAELLPGTLDLSILKAVSLGPRHGYGVLPRIEQISGDSLCKETESGNRLTTAMASVLNTSRGEV